MPNQIAFLLRTFLFYGVDMMMLCLQYDGRSTSC